MAVTLEKTVCCSEYEYSCECNARKIVGLALLIAATVAVIFSGIFAAGVFGGGEMGYIAGGLVIGSMLCFAAAAVLLIPNKDVSE